MYEYKAKVIRIVDGDTLVVDIDLGLRTRREEVIRLYGINAPELNTREGHAAKDFLAYLVGQDVTILTIKDKQEKYGRWLGIISFNSLIINNLLVEKGFAVNKDY